MVHRVFTVIQRILHACLTSLIHFNVVMPAVQHYKPTVIALACVDVNLTI